MVFSDNPQNGPVRKAAEMALVTGDADYVLLWVLKESENTLKNLLEKTCCERNSQKYVQNNSPDWYFETVNRLFERSWKTDFSGRDSGGFDENPIVRMVQRAIESGEINELCRIVPQPERDDLMQRFIDLIHKRNYDLHNLAAGRAYVSAFLDFTGRVHNLVLRNFT